MTTQVVEVTQSQTGSTLLQVNGYKFRCSRKDPDTLHVLWQCIHSKCPAKFYADERNEIIQHSDNCFVHNHLVRNRTNLVKDFVFEEINKLAAKRNVVNETELKKHAFKYLDKNYGNSLDLNELRTVQSAIIKHVHHLKMEQRKNGKRKHPQEGTGKKKKKMPDLLPLSSAKQGRISTEEDERKDYLSFLEIYASDSSETESDENKQTGERNADTHLPQRKGQPTESTDIRQDYFNPGSGKENTPKYATTALDIAKKSHSPLPEKRSNQSARTQTGLEEVDEIENDKNFFMNLLPLFNKLKSTDKQMIKSQITQLVNWKLQDIL